MRVNFKFKNIAGKFFDGGMSSSEAKEINPRRDWNIILSFFILALFLLIAFGFYMYWKINKGWLFATVGGNEPLIETIDRSELKKIINLYEAKNQLFQEIKFKKPEVIDPSL